MTLKRKKKWGNLTPLEFMRRLSTQIIAFKNEKREPVKAALIVKNRELFQEYLRQHCPYAVGQELMLYNKDSQEYDLWEVIRIDAPDVDWKARVVTIPIALTCLNPLRPQPDQTLTIEQIYQLTKTNQPTS